MHFKTELKPPIITVVLIFSASLGFPGFTGPLQGSIIMVFDRKYPVQDLIRLVLNAQEYRWSSI
jgi:hypothetical protein